MYPDSRLTIFTIRVLTRKYTEVIQHAILYLTMSNKTPTNTIQNIGVTFYETSSSSPVLAPTFNLTIENLDEQMYVRGCEECLFSLYQDLEELFRRKHEVVKKHVSVYGSR
jgi:hypothetical protein